MPFHSKHTLDDYIPQSTLQEDGTRITEYVYKGRWVLWDLDASSLKAFKRRSLGLSLTSLLFFLAAGLQRCAANTLPPVAITGILSLLAWTVGTTALIFFSPKRLKTPETDFQIMELALKTGFLLQGLLAGAAAFFCVVPVFSTDPPAFGQELTAICFYLLCSLSALFLFQKIRKLPHHTEP